MLLQDDDFNVRNNWCSTDLVQEEALNDYFEGKNMRLLIMVLTPPLRFPFGA
jgi:hypothetical protein